MQFPEIIAFKITPEQRARIDWLAMLQGKSTSEWIRDVLDREADRLTNKSEGRRNAA